jgi:proteasome accessory factor A
MTKHSANGILAETPYHGKDVVPKLTGADIELGNFILGGEGAWQGDTGARAASALLAEMPGLAGSERQASDQGGYGCKVYPSWRNPSVYIVSDGASYVRDWGRKFIPANGGCAYIDHAHLEICLPETLSAFDHCAAFHAMLRIVRDALQQANRNLGQGKIQVLVNNTDGHSKSYGSHTNFLISRRCFENIFDRRLHYLLYLASYLASSIVFTGAGKVGSENGRDPVDYQISQRADFYESLIGSQTTYHRPIVNSRDEALCEKTSMARLHVIFNDNTLMHVANLLKVGVLQIVLAMIEQDQITTNLILEDPLKAVVTWSHDPQLRSGAETVSGMSYSAADLQLAIFSIAHRFVMEGRADGIVPHAKEIIELWGDTLSKLKARDFAALAPRLDWVLKWTILKRVMERSPELTWNSPELKHIDHLYSSLEDGLYWIYEEHLVEKVVPEDVIERFRHKPPDDTRAWLRTWILRHAEAVVDQVDWDAIRLRFKTADEGSWPRYVYRNIRMENPLISRRDCERIFEHSSSIEEALESLGLEGATFDEEGKTKSWLPMVLQ